MTDVFDMPGQAAGFQARAGWLVRRLMIDLSLTMEQAAGFVGNLGYESGEFKSLQEIRPQVSGSRGGYGWSQWTASRRVAFEGYCADHGMVPSSDYANYCYLVAELRMAAWQGFLNKLRNAASLEDAARLTEQYYERPQEAIDGTFASLPTRIAKGRVALAGAKQAIVPKDDVTDHVGPEPPAERPKDAPADLTKEIAAVKAIQATLTILGTYHGKIDGDWGDKSEAALGALFDRFPGIETY